MIKEPFLSDIFRFKFREFVQCFDTYVNNMSGGCSAGKTMQKKLQYLKEGYETKFTDLKERILEDMKSCVQRDGIGVVHISFNVPKVNRFQAKPKENFKN